MERSLAGRVWANRVGADGHGRALSIPAWNEAAQKKKNKGGVGLFVLSQLSTTRTMALALSLSFLVHMAIVTGIVVPGSIGRSQARCHQERRKGSWCMALPLLVDVAFKGSRLIAFCFSWVGWVGWILLQECNEE